MYKLIIYQENMLLISIIIGIVMGATYDVLRGLRRMFRHNALVVSLEDIVYWLVWTIVIVLFFQCDNSGVLRLYIFAAIILGLLLYLLTISRIYLYLLTGIIEKIKKLIRITKKMLKSAKKRVMIKTTVRNRRKINGGR